MNKQQRTVSRILKQRWKDPAYRAQMVAAGRAKWRRPEFVDKQIRAMVRRWQDDGFRARQLRRVTLGTRGLPMENAPRGDPCIHGHPVHGPCIRQDVHKYHVAIAGRPDDGSFRIHGWEPEADG